MLVGCSGCRIRREASRSDRCPWQRSGLAHRSSWGSSARGSGGEGRRRKPAQGGEAAGTVAGPQRSRGLSSGICASGDRENALRGRGHSSREGVPVSVQRSSLTRWWRRRSPAAASAGSIARSSEAERSWSGASEVMSCARPAAEKAAGGKHSAEGSSIETSPPVPRGARIGRGAWLRPCDTPEGSWQS